ncbi:MAG TPA: M17 family peptidase N-terminal domain-containing protein, partial [Clostridia bacterium]|nr:M17 family peptidase N-terminal domain-containing protein [Clostridia bacterium]
MKLNIRTDANTKEYNGIIVPMDAKKLEGTILATQMARLVESGKLKAEGGSTFKVTRGGENITEVTFMVIDEKYYGSYRKLLSIFGDAYRSLRSSKADHIAIDFIQGTVAADEKTVKAAVEAVLMAEYSFDDFKTKEENKEEATVDVLVERDAFGEVKREAEVLAAMNLKARELVNLPANHINPTTLAERAVKLGQEHGFETQVLGFDEIKALGMEAFLSVARASEEEPKLIVMRYTGNPDSDERLGLVGKGLTYDSGGLSIKSTAGMVDMKGDMAGAAAVIGAISAVASMKLRVNVTSVVAACENMISGRSYRPGDIIGSMGKKSIF